MNRSQQQALAQLRVDNAKHERSEAMDALIAATPGNVQRAAQDSANATHRLEQAEQALYQI